MSKPDIKICKRGHEFSATDRQCRICSNILARKRRKKNPEKAKAKDSKDNNTPEKKAYMKKYAEDNREHLKEYKKGRDYGNRFTLREKALEKYYQNKERYNKQSLDRYYANKDEINKAAREENAANTFLKMLAGLSELTKTLKQHENNDTTDKT